MRREPVARIIKKVDHWPLADRRQHLIQVLEHEKGRHRRRLLCDALKDLTTRVLKQELRGRRQ